MINSRVKTAFAAMTGVSVMLGGAGLAEAALVQTFTIDEHGSPSQTLSFDAATPNVGGNGALTEVTIAFSTLTVGGGDQVTLTGGEGGTASRGGITAGLEVTDTAGTLFSGTSTTAASTCSVSGTVGCTGTKMSPSQPSFSPGNPVTITDGGTLANFVGSPVQLTALISSYSVAPATCVPRGFGTPTCGGSDDITWSPTVTVSYTYAFASDVPEPATMGILGLGGVALGLLRRRRSPAAG